MPMRKRTFRKRTFKRKGAKLNKRQKVEVKRLITAKEELKFSDTNVAGGITTAITPVAMATPTQGNGAVQRVGDDINLRKISLRLNIRGGGAALGVADQFNTVRLIIFRWSQNNAVTAPTQADVLQYAAPLSYTSPYNWDAQAQGKVKICYDRAFTFTQGGTQTRVVLHEIFGKKLHGKVVKYNGGTQQGTNMFYYLVISDSTVIPNPSWDGYMRMVFSDS